MLHEIRRRNLTVFLVRLVKIIWLPIVVGLIAARTFLPVDGAVAGAATLLIAAPICWAKSIADRFHNKRFHHLWNNCLERHASLQKALKQLKKSQAIEFHELPKTVDSVGESLYYALRKADVVEHELRKSEGIKLSGIPRPTREFYDQEAKALQSQALQRDSDYHGHLSQVIGSVEQAEAQANLYISSLDNLRIQVLKHRLGGRLVKDHGTSQELRDSLNEAKMMLDSIDKALEELDAEPFTMPAAPPIDDEPPQEQETKA